MDGNVRKCPRCGRPVTSVYVLGCDITSRAGLPLALAAGFLAGEMLCLGLNLFDAGEELVLALGLRLLLAAGVRFVLAYVFVWASLLHIGHRQKGEWKEAVLLAVLAPAVTFASLPFVLH